MNNAPGAMPHITAVIPCYNHGRYLSQSVESVLNQLDVSVEVIIVDDGSDDGGTVVALEQFERREKVQVVTKEQGGPGDARNAGLALVSTEYALILDADDFVDPSFASTCLRSMAQDPSIGFASSWIRATGAASWEFRPRGGGEAEFVQRNECGSMGVLRTSAWRAVGGYSSRLAFEDWDFYLRLVERGWKVHVVRELLAHYRLNEQSRNIAAGATRPEAVAQLVAVHRDLFARNIVAAIEGREGTIADLRSGLEQGRLDPIFGDGSAGHRLRERR